MDEVSQEGGRENFVPRDQVSEGLRKTIGLAAWKSLDEASFPGEVVKKALLQ